MVINPCEYVEPLPVEEQEMTFLTLKQISVYMDCCASHYRLLAWFLIQTGARISEAIAVRIVDLDLDLDLDNHIVRIYRQRGRFATKATKSRGKFRAERSAASG